VADNNTFGYNSKDQCAMSDDYIATTALFGEVKKYILSKDFKFGNLTNVFGRTTVDFCNADINGAAVMTCTQLFGEIRIKAPANWHIVSEGINIFAVVDDKRRSSAVNIDNNKVLILRGTGIFGTIKIIDCFS
jgi:hypothetical protein